MPAAPGRFRLLLIVSALLAVAAALHAVAVNRASTLLPSSWSWADDRTVAWLLVGGTALLTVLLAGAFSAAQAAEARRADRRRLDVRTAFEFQSTIGVHRPPSSAIRWKPMFELSYTGSRVLTVLDIVPLAPTLPTNEDSEVCLVRTKASEYFTAYPTFGSLAEAHDEEAGDAHLLERWPLLLAPGQRVRLVVEQEYEMRLDGSPMYFASDEEALVVFGEYFQLNGLGDGRIGMGTVLMPTRIVCADDAWEVDVPYLILPIGATLIIPEPREVDEDELL